MKSNERKEKNENQQKLENIDVNEIRNKAKELYFNAHKSYELKKYDETIDTLRKSKLLFEYLLDKDPEKGNKGFYNEKISKINLQIPQCINEKDKLHFENIKNNSNEKKQNYNNIVDNNNMNMNDNIVSSNNRNVNNFNNINNNINKNPFQSNLVNNNNNFNSNNRQIERINNHQIHNQNQNQNQNQMNNTFNQISYGSYDLDSYLGDSLNSLNLCLTYNKSKSNIDQIIDNFSYNVDYSELNNYKRVAIEQIKLGIDNEFELNWKSAYEYYTKASENLHKITSVIDDRDNLFNKAFYLEKQNECVRKADEMYKKSKNQ